MIDPGTPSSHDPNVPAGKARGPLKAYKFLIGQRGRELDGITYSNCLGIAVARDVDEARALLFASLEARMGEHAAWVRIAAVTEIPIDVPGVLGWSML